jgi:hypothetical protein
MNFRWGEFFQIPTFLLLKFLRQINGVWFSCSNSALASKIPSCIAQV